MTDLQLEATSRTPAVTLDPVAGKLVIAGESYPEDITAFYAQLTAATGAVAKACADSSAASLLLVRASR